MSTDEAPPPADNEPVPRLPRTTHFKFSFAAFFRIFLTACLLAMIIVARRPCADAVSGFVTSFDGSGSAASQMPKPGTVDIPSPSTNPNVGSAGDYETLRPDMTEAEIKAAIERAKAKERERQKAQQGSAGSSGSSASGSSASGSSASGSPASGSSSGSSSGSARGTSAPTP